MADEDVTNGSKVIFRNSGSDTSVSVHVGKTGNNADLDNGTKTECKDDQASNGSDGTVSGKDKSRPGSGESTQSSEFEFIELEPITENRVAQVMGEIRKHHYSPACVEDKLGLQGDCIHLFKRDYNIEVVGNESGQLSYNYPQQLIIPVGRKNDFISTNVKFDKEQYIKLVEETFIARSRGRFVVPVILFDNKFICRCGTVGNPLSAAFATITQAEIPQTQLVEKSALESGQNLLSGASSAITTTVMKTVEATKVLSGRMTALMSQDADLLKLCGVEHICDLMVENTKMAVCQTLPVSSSEKVNKDIYKDFQIEQMPFPGCEFFELYHDAGRKPEGLIFNWDAPEVDSELKLSEDANLSFPDIEWEKFKEWDLIKLTKAYMMVLLTYLARDTGSLVVHCISGWDRTPLFICLLRVSLWADGVVHESLNTAEMAYLTLAYDWYLFGHNFPTRYRKHEEVMHFCFNFMKHMASDEFSVTRIFGELPIAHKEYRQFPEFTPEERRKKINEIGALLLRIYNDEIINKAEEEMIVDAESEPADEAKPSETEDSKNMEAA